MTEEMTCFIAMPVATRKDDAERHGDDEHWRHVMEELFVPAIEAAGLVAIKPIAQGSDLIHGRIIKQLSDADMVLCDLSAHNPNVFFELGVRTSQDLPIALVTDGLSKLPFDTSVINTHTYDPKLELWTIERQRASLAEHIRQSVASCDGRNPLWSQFGLTIKAQEPMSNESPAEAKLDVLANAVQSLHEQLALDRDDFERSRLRNMSRSGRSWANRSLSEGQMTLRGTEIKFADDRPFTLSEREEVHVRINQMCRSVGFHFDVYFVPRRRAVRVSVTLPPGTPIPNDLFASLTEFAQESQFNIEIVVDVSERFEDDDHKAIRN